MKRFLEMRGGDGGPWKSLCALPAFWVGLLYDQSALDAAWDLVKDWTLEEHQHLRDQVPKQALHTPFRGRPLNAVAARAVEIADAGLKARNRLDGQGDNESHFLALLRSRVERDRKSVVEGKSVSVRVVLGGRRIINKKIAAHSPIY